MPRETRSMKLGDLAYPGGDLWRNMLANLDRRKAVQQNSMPTLTQLVPNRGESYEQKPFLCMAWTCCCFKPSGVCCGAKELCWIGAPFEDASGCNNTGTLVDQPPRMPWASFRIPPAACLSAFSMLQCGRVAKARPWRNYIGKWLD